jgi:hypothetical protein
MSGISNLINYIGAQGVQDTSRYSVKFEDSTGTFYYTESVVSIDIPGPRYEFLNINYWQGNPYFRMPIGLRYEDPIIIEMLVPENPTNSTYNNFMNALPAWTQSQFTVPSTGVFFGGDSRNRQSFSWKKRNPGIKGLTITINALSKDAEGNAGGNKINKSYTYIDCFFEKILPVRFNATSSDPQTITMSFLVGGMA